MLDASLFEVKDLKGVGEKTALKFKQNDIITLKDLYLNVPSRYLSYNPLPLRNAIHNTYVTLVGKIVSTIKYQYYRAHFTSLIFNLLVDGEVLKVIIFNRPYLQKVLRPGELIKVYGKYNLYKKELLAANLFKDELDNHIEAFYKFKEPSAKTVSKLVKNAFSLGYRVKEYLPEVILEKYHFLELNEMLYYLHNPDDLKTVEKAKERRKYEEILEFYLRLTYFENLKKSGKRPKINYDLEKVKALIKSIPFELTTDQKEVTNEIFKDFLKPYPANRLIEGDVGSGKTIVALIASYAMVTAHKQVVMMVPTEILAYQQGAYFKKYLEAFNCHVEILTASLNKKERTQILENLKSGKTDIVIGTHALYYDKITYHDLGLAIIDEQHRFGVNARNKLLNNGEAIDAIYLSATPIPRTLGLTLFSDLDLSQIKTKRENKKEIFTKVLTLENFDFVLKHLKSELSKGHQAYFVTSSIENGLDSMRFDLEEVKNLILQNIPEAKIGLLHGKMKDNLKQQEMEKFLNKEYDILVSTTVIEVGISVDNATIICIMDAENFGLSQLHQLRGRVGRADLNGACYLVTNNLDIERLKALESTNDGFMLAEMDLKLRGPGDYFGMRQSGFSEFVFADFNADFELFKKIKEDAFKLFNLSNSDLEVKKYVDRVLDSLKFNEKLN